jgi:hypothetical protein
MILSLSTERVAFPFRADTVTAENLRRPRPMEPQATRWRRLGKSSEAQAMERVRFRRRRRSARGMPQRVSGTRGGGLFNAVERSRFSPKAKEGKRDSLL